MTRGVQIMSDKGGEWMLRHWMREFRRHNPDLPVTLIDYGCTRNATKAFQAQGGSVKTCPPGIRNMTFETRSTAIKGLAPYDVTICSDLDVVVQGSLDQLFEQFEACGKSFGACADRHYPWCWHPNAGEESNRLFPIMSGFIIIRKGSPVIADWIKTLLTWSFPVRVDGMNASADGKRWQHIGNVTFIGGPNNAFRDDMQALSMIYRIGHPDVWELPPMTQWFRLDGGDPLQYLVAHYTGAPGKEMLKNERGWK